MRARLVLTAALAAALAAPALAQSADTPTRVRQPIPRTSVGQPGPRTDQGTASPNGRDAGPATTASREGADSPLRRMRAGDLEGKTLHAATGKAVGDIERVVVSRADGTPAVVVGVGGFLGLGERDVAVPLGEIGVDRDGRLRSVLTRDQIASMRAYGEKAYDVLDGDRDLGDALSASR